MHDIYDFGMVKLDCRRFKERVISTIDGLRRAMEDYMVAKFKVILDKQVDKNEEMWRTVTIVHTDVDETIA